MVLGRGKYGRELHSGSLVSNHGSRPYVTTLICPEICPKDIKYWYRVLKYGFGCLLNPCPLRIYAADTGVGTHTGYSSAAISSLPGPG